MDIITNTTIINQAKKFIGIDDKDDELLEVLYDISVKKIIKYLNDSNLTEYDIIQEYSSALVLCIKDAYNYQKNKLKNEGIKQESQGSRSRTYDITNNSSLSDDVKSCLPLPRVRLL